MNESHQLNLVGVGWPICLLEYQQRLTHLVPGDLLVVQVEDPEVAATLCQLALKQGDRIVGEVREGKLLKLEIQRHAPIEGDFESTWEESV